LHTKNIKLGNVPDKLDACMHNSNHQLHQVTLSGETIEEEKFHVIGFVPANVIHLTEDIWFRKLNSEQIDSVTQFISTY
jgi:hypothetical protein